MLKTITVRIHSGKGTPVKQYYTGGIDELYYMNLGKVNCNGIKIINVYLSDSDSYRKVLPAILEQDCKFDLLLYDQLKDNPFQWKKEVLMAIHSTLLKLCDEFNWDAKPFEAAYEKCMEQQLELKWFFKNRLFLSPDKQHYIGFYHWVDVGAYKVYEVLYDKKKSEIARRLCFQDEVSVFKVSKVLWEEDSCFFTYQFNGPEKLFKTYVADIIENKPLELNKPTSAFF
ncbi:hypothetical protein HNQ91_002827 [Filimonas zeae]|uniref:Uncharacterized protein n=1 Tax=Filimonas zeae TaxID=1737353 RepID=A0A917MWL3_9BACT|nr:hypothetical protein [Filimonas zeae]MDR6339762.1 hypothetical protein [Filimonas zeae]GGH69512.1 hypothetical protein GCM10011379_26890 [Filimonas zeae]